MHDADLEAFVCEPVNASFVGRGCCYTWQDGSSADEAAPRRLIREIGNSSGSKTVTGEQINYGVTAIAPA